VVWGGRRKWSLVGGSRGIECCCQPVNGTEQKPTRTRNKTEKMKEFAICDQTEKLSKTEKTKKFAKNKNNEQKCAKPELPKTPSNVEEQRRKSRKKTKQNREQNRSSKSLAQTGEEVASELCPFKNVKHARNMRATCTSRQLLHARLCGMGER